MPPARRESEATPVKVKVKTVVVRSGTASFRAAAFWIPIPAGRPPGDQRDRNERGARQAHQDIGPCLEPGRALRDARQILKVREEVGVIQKEAVDGAFEDHHLHSVVVLELRDYVSDLQNEFRTHEVERRVVEYDSTV